MIHDRHSYRQPSIVSATQAAQAIAPLHHFGEVMIATMEVDRNDLARDILRLGTFIDFGSRVVVMSIYDIHAGVRECL